jgi:hypothetical protein
LALFSTALSYGNWSGNGTLLSSLSLFVQYLYATDKEEATWDSNGKFQPVKDAVFSHIMTSIAWPEAIVLLTQLMTQVRSSRDSMVELEWKQYSQQILDKLLPFLSSSKESLIVLNSHDLTAMYDLCHQLSTTSVSPEKLLDSMLLCGDSVTAPYCINGDRIEERMLSEAHWLPGLLVVS